MRPVIALDVDGVLLPFGKPVEFNPQLQFWLAELAYSCDLIWATSWGHQANIEIGPALNLPELPVVDKASVPQWGAPSLLVWIDDMFTECQAELAEEIHAAGRKALFVGTDPHVGLTLADVNAIHYWLAHPF